MKISNKMEIYVKTIKKYPCSHLVVYCDGKADSIHYNASHAYARAKYLKNTATKITN